MGEGILVRQGVDEAGEHVLLQGEAVDGHVVAGPVSTWGQRGGAPEGEGPRFHPPSPLHGKDRAGVEALRDSSCESGDLDPHDSTVLQVVKNYITVSNRLTGGSIPSRIRYFIAAVAEWATNMRS